MASSEGNQLLAGAFHATDILQITKKWNWKCIFIHQGYFFRKIPAINAKFAPKCIHFQGWSPKFGQNVKMFQPKQKRYAKCEFKLTKLKDLFLNNTDILAKER